MQTAAGTTHSLTEIDFLPQRYRENHARMRTQTWALAVVVLLGGMLGAASAYQLQLRQSLRNRLAEVEVQHVEAEARSAFLTQLQQHQKQESEKADLYAYLKHPWPKTQLLSAVASSLPPSATLTSLRITRETASAPGAAADARRGRRTQPEQVALSPAVQDLAQLRNAADTARIILFVEGVSSDAAALHNYLGQLNHHGLLSRAELSSVESSGNGTLRFALRLVVRPGYGQPGGPTGTAPTMPSDQAAAMGWSQP